MIHKIQTDDDVTLALSGRLDSVTQSDLAQELETVFKTQVSTLTLDLSALEYLSSAGLRVFLSARKKASEMGGKVKIWSNSFSEVEISQKKGRK